MADSDTVAAFKRIDINLLFCHMYKYKISLCNRKMYLYFISVLVYYTHVVYVKCEIHSVKCHSFGISFYGV